MAKKSKGGAVAEVPTNGAKTHEPETYKGWQPVEGGPLVISDELKTKIDHYETLEPSDAGSLKADIEKHGLARVADDGPKPFGDTHRGWKAKDDAALFEDADYDALLELIDSWAEADDVAAADTEAVLIQRGLEKTPIAAEARAERRLQVAHPSWQVIGETPATPKKGEAPKPVTYRAETLLAGGAKTASVESKVALLALIERAEKAAASAAAEPAKAPTGDPKASAASPADAQDLSARNVLREDHERLKTRLRTLEERANEGLTESAKLHIADYERRIETICTGLEGGWRDPELDIKGIISLRARLSCYEEFIADLQSGGVTKELQDARDALKTFEARNPLFLGSAVRNPTAPGVDAPAKVETKAKAAEAKDKLAAAVEKAASAEAAPEKPKSEGQAKLEALLKEPSPVYTGPELTQETRGELASLNFRWTGKTTTEATKARVEEALVGWKAAKAAKGKNRIEDTTAVLLSFGWERVEPKLVGAAV